MTETKQITALYVVTDSETHYDNIGDIDGGLFDDNWLEKHIERYGQDGLLRRLSGMITQVYNTNIKVLNKNQDVAVKNT